MRIPHIIIGVALTSVFIIGCSKVPSKASPDEQSRFLNAVRDAYTKKDGRAVVALLCFDSVSNADRIKEQYSAAYPFYDYKIASIEYETPDPVPSKTTTLDSGTYTNFNLTVIKRIKIVYDSPMTNTLILAIGEKNGKLLVALLATNSIPQP